MGFTPPPTLPDFSKLLITLTNSGIQKWNPPLNDILKSLIAAAGQSQEVIVKTAIPNAIAAIPPPVPGALFEVTITLTPTIIIGLFTTPQILAGGISNQLTVPLHWGYSMTKNGNGWVNGGANLKLRYNTSNVQAANNLPLALNNTVVGNFGATAFGSPITWTSLQTDNLGRSVEVICDQLLSADAGLPAPTAGGHLSLLYYQIAQ